MEVTLGVPLAAEIKPSLPDLGNASVGKSRLRDSFRVLHTSSNDTLLLQGVLSPFKGTSSLKHTKASQ